MGVCPRRAGLISRIGELRHNPIVILAGEWTAKTSGVGRGLRGVQCAHSSLHTRVMGEEVVLLYNIQHYQILEKFKRKKCICDLDIIAGLPQTRFSNTTATRLPCRNETSSSRVTVVFCHFRFF